MRRIAITSCALLLSLPVGAAAKEVTGAKVCGADGCSTVHGKHKLQAIAEGEMAVSGPRKPMPFYRAHLQVSEGEKVMGRWNSYILPKQGLIGTDDGQWVEMSAEGRKVYRGATIEHRPFPASEMPQNAIRPLHAARVVEVVRPPAATKTVTKADSNGFTWWPLLFLLVPAGWLIARRRRAA